MKQNVSLALVKSLAFLLLFIAGSAVALGAAEIGLSQATLAISDKPTKGFSSTFTVANNGTVNLTGLSVALSSTELSGFNITISPSAFSVNAGSTQTVTVTGTVPKDINTRLSPFSGTVSVSNAQVSQSLTLDVNAITQLSLDSLKIVVDGKSKSVDTGDTVKDAKPGSKVEIKGDVENLFTDDEDIVIEDVEVTITIENIDDDEDLEEEIDVGDVDADEQESFRIEFQVPEDVDDGEYEVTIQAEAEDENGAKHFVEVKNIDLEVEKDRNEIQIRKVSLSPAKISCSKTFNINVGLKNQGRDDEDEVVVRIESSDLEIDFEDTSIPELDEGTGSDTEFAKGYTFKVPDGIEPGNYPIAVKSFYDTDTLSNIKNIDLVVEECSKAAPSPVSDLEEEGGFEEDTTVVVTPADEEETEDLGVITEPVTSTTEALGLSTPFLWAMGGLLVLGLVVIIVLVFVLVGMKKRD
ncbi:hypothetical protein HYV84_01725 [Candidatus Woesearchaeota archaeon]|nr:hypothetical protein [Candidatus Woesearchaeota archaeon]